MIDEDTRSPFYYRENHSLNNRPCSGCHRLMFETGGNSRCFISIRMIVLENVSVPSRCPLRLQAVSDGLIEPNERIKERY